MAGVTVEGYVRRGEYRNWEVWTNPSNQYLKLVVPDTQKEYAFFGILHSNVGMCPKQDTPVMSVDKLKYIWLAPDHNPNSLIYYEVEFYEYC